MKARELKDLEAQEITLEESVGNKYIKTHSANKSVGIVKSTPSSPSLE